MHFFYHSYQVTLFSKPETSKEFLLRFLNCINCVLGDHSCYPQLLHKLMVVFFFQKLKPSLPCSYKRLFYIKTLRNAGFSSFKIYLQDLAALFIQNIRHTFEQHASSLSFLYTQPFLLITSLLQFNLLPSPNMSITYKLDIFCLLLFITLVSMPG